jgi:hypothetical protein
LIFHNQHQDTHFAVVVSSTVADADDALPAEVSDDTDEISADLASKSKPPRLFFHRLDVLPPKQQSKLCRHLSAPATLESGSLFLSADAFYEPWDRPRIVRGQVPA